MKNNCKVYRFYIGTHDKDKLEKIKPDAEFIDVFDSLFSGTYTLQEARGRYTMQNTNTVINEKTFIITVIDNYTCLELKDITGRLKDYLNQETIMVEISSNCTDVKFM